MAVSKIMVTLDGSPLSIATMEQAVTMAGRIESSIDFVFVEDINLKHLSNLSHIKIISPFVPSDHVFKEKEIEDIFKSQENSLKKAISLAMRDKHNKYNFITSSGNVLKEITKNITERKPDLVVFAWSGWKTVNYYFSDSYIQGRSHQNFPNLTEIPLSNGLKTVIKQKATSILVIAGVIPLNTQIITFFDGSLASERGIKYIVGNISEMLGHLSIPHKSRAENLPLNIVCKKEQTANLENLLKKHGQSANIIATDKLSPDSMKGYIKKSKSKLFIATYDTPFASDLDKILQELEKLPISFMFIKV